MSRYMPEQHQTQIEYMQRDMADFSGTGAPPVDSGASSPHRVRSEKPRVAAGFSTSEHGGYCDIRSPARAHVPLNPTTPKGMFSENE